MGACTSRVMAILGQAGLLEDGGNAIEDDAVARGTIVRVENGNNNNNNNNNTIGGVLASGSGYVQRNTNTNNSGRNSTNEGSGGAGGGGRLFGAAIGLTGSSSNNSTTQRDEAQQTERRLKSIDSLVSTHICFRNRSTVPVRLYWVNYDGEEVPYRTLQLGQSCRQQTFVTHPWTFRTALHSGKPVSCKKRTVWK